MLTQCTKVLLDRIGLKGDELYDRDDHLELPNRFIAWHAHLIKIGRKKAVILVNNETKYSVLIYGPVKKDFSNIKNLIHDAIAEALRMEGIHKDVIDAYLAKAGEINFSKTGSRSMISRMNNIVDEMSFYDEYIDKNSKIQRYISILTGTFIQSSNDKKTGFYPIEKTYECLQSMIDSDEQIVAREVMDVDLYQLKIQINIDGHDIWRRVLVPSTYSFRYLHHIIQTVFDWHNSHLHDFTVTRPDNKLLKIVMDDHPDILDYLNFDLFEVAQERFVALEEVFSNFDEVFYEYDFGDSWEHVITLENVVKSDVFEATYVDGNGERPPEDVGGSWGFEEYLRIMANENDPSHHDMKIWAEEQKDRQLTAKQINKRLDSVIRGYRY